VEFRLGFVGSQVAPVVLDHGDAAALLHALEDRFDEYELGIPDLVGRLRDGEREGAEMTVDEKQAGELLAVLQTVKRDDPVAFSDRLARLEAACLNYRR